MYFSRKNAQSVASLLPQEPMGVQYSQQNFTDYVNAGLDLAYEQSYRTIGSQDNLYPSTAFYKLRRQLNGQIQPSYKVRPIPLFQYFLITVLIPGWLHDLQCF